MNKKKILVVDDEIDMLSVLAKRFSAEGYSVITVDNGEDALNLARLERPSLIILDVAMPQMDGGEVAEKLKEHSETRKIPVIFLTGLFSKSEEDKMGTVIGGNVTFAKPYDIEELLTTVKRLLRQTTNIA